MRLVLAAFLVQVALASPAPRDGLSVELHAHLFMKDGMTWAFRGGFSGALEATSWKDRFSSQANPEALERSGIGILVAALYAHPLMTLSLRDSIRRQVREASDFVKTHAEWILAREPEQARKALASGKHVLILALEGASGILETESDLKEFIDQDGIRIVTILHLTDDEFGGVSFLGGTRSLSTPFAWLGELLHSNYSEGVHSNRRGLSDQGHWLARALIGRGAWIDLPHASDASQRELIELLEKAHFPLLYTHTVLRKYSHTERGIADWQIQQVGKTGGMVGLMPSPEMLEGTPTRPETCEGTLQALAVQYKDLAAQIDPDEIALGSDYNGGIPHLKPGCSGIADLDRNGLWNIGQAFEVWEGLRRSGCPVPSPPSRVQDRFLDAWARVRAPSSSRRSPH